MDEAEGSPDRCLSLTKITNNNKKFHTETLVKIGKNSGVGRETHQNPDVAEPTADSSGATFGRLVK